MPPIRPGIVAAANTRRRRLTKNQGVSLRHPRLPPRPGLEPGGSVRWPIPLTDRHSSGSGT